jgi:hypothetical protein
MLLFAEYLHVSIHSYNQYLSLYGYSIKSPVIMAFIPIPIADIPLDSCLT